MSRYLPEGPEKLTQTGTSAMLCLPCCHRHQMLDNVPQQYVCEKEDILANEPCCSQDRNSGLDQENSGPIQIKEEQEELCTSLDQEVKQEQEKLCTSLDQEVKQEKLCTSVGQEYPEPPQMKEKQEELYTNQEGVQLVLKEETDMLVQCKSKCKELSGEIFSIFEKTLVHYEGEIDHQRRLLSIIWKPDIKLHKIDLLQQHVCTEQVTLADQLPCNQERSSSLDQEDPDPPQIKEEDEDLWTSMDQEDPESPQIKEEQEDLCNLMDGEQLVLKVETDIFMVTPNYKESDHRELNQNSDQLLSHNSPVAERPDNEQNQHINSGSIKNAESKAKKTHHNNSSHNNDINNSSLSGSQYDTGTGKKCVECDVCGKAFKDRSQLNRHYKIHTGVKPYACSTCGKRFYEISSMRRHERIHTGEKLYPCKICRKKFSTNSHLKVHLRIHTGEKRYSCELCGKSFRQSSGLKVHMRTHTGEKKHSCKICGKKFGQNSHVIVHMRTHTGEKLYFCEICGKSFSQSSHLIVHMKTHTAKSKSRKRWKNSMGYHA
ncbi:zinc finger and SCAN domain-containing protein 31-like isoform X2 [Amphiprion ocellaris]|uniref:zinc finger and SCAN domain-containing protein 31-like isoform X2 n=1 Tax=Amphiprion ocellaris TaxID=80972 RepID=UPI0024111DB0|nr:zinc finger and SCAN domain-containing protein 31-like isoform X2 [Amphiprion ocellaris]